MATTDISLDRGNGRDRRNRRNWRLDMNVRCAVDGAGVRPLNLDAEGVAIGDIAAFAIGAAEP